MDTSEATAAYVIKLHTHNHGALFGEVEGSQVHLNEMGLIVTDEWQRLVDSPRPGIRLDYGLVTPTYLQGIVILREQTGDPLLEATLKPRLLSAFVAGFKAAAAKRINLQRNQPGSPVWQRSYDEQLISDTVTLMRIRQQLQQQIDQ